MGDKWWQTIVENSPQVANIIRENEKELLPKGMKKKKESVTNWL